jgi:hypothetical protein
VSAIIHEVVTISAMAHVNLILRAVVEYVPGVPATKLGRD